MSPTQALARKWRPKDFSQLTGQEHIVKALSNALQQNRLHHAYLLTGTRGVGKTTIARILAKSLNCETGITAKPCGICSICMQIDSGSFIDLVELDAASNTQVDNMRELLENAIYAPTSGRFKIYLIDEVHMLSKSAFNAMLKTLEEPPMHVKFVLATTDPQKIPVTVLSRCLQFNLKHIPQQQIADHLKYVLTQENITYAFPALQLIARAAQGSMRDALSLLDQAIAYSGENITEDNIQSMLGITSQDYLVNLLKALTQGDGAGMLSIADEIEAQCLSFDLVLQDLATLLHRIALAQTIPDKLNRDAHEYPAIALLAKAFSAEDIQLFYQIALHGRSDLSLAPDEYAGFTMTLMRMLAFNSDELAKNEYEKPSQPKGDLNKPENAIIKKSTSAVEQKVAPPTPSLHNTAFQSLNWTLLISQLNLSGMSKMLAQHSEAKFLPTEKIEIYVPEQHKHLLEKKYQDKIQTALNDYFSKPITLNFYIGTLTGITPLETHNLEAKEKQAQSIAHIEQDPIVQQLIENFDAKLVTSSIKPIKK
ncbi:DNA polymerase-3 subunit gamma/tau [Nitrosomonas sp. PY1]|uniref:DNA polymerase III subunit gamma/tau n=1 Tax=Nitrosomonas sp. PY1 TaxID=1803906 RepID=UPI001FC7E4BE|nr:DNA polymerase III subunit gamma/tau [Nitrosomonas sp. PY1]GKS69063.1 DNA polymerase-3 subunit gamma/tau [Nitrosomonas sp. PY1]